MNIERPKGKMDSIKSDIDGINIGCKWVILVDGQTKSMGEAFASSFKLINDATIIGEQTFGKANMETILQLNNGYSLKYTVGRLYNANGETWAGKGITPDISMPIPAESGSEEDTVLKLAIDYLTK